MVFASQELCSTTHLLNYQKIKVIVFGCELCGIINWLCCFCNALLYVCVLCNISNWIYRLGPINPGIFLKNTPGIMFHPLTWVVGFRMNLIIEIHYYYVRGGSIAFGALNKYLFCLCYWVFAQMLFSALLKNKVEGNVELYFLLS